MAESLALSLKLQGFDEAQVALSKLGTNGAQAQKQVEAATKSTTSTVGQFGRAMSSVAAIAAATTGVLSIFARNNAELQDKLEKATVALSLASVAMRGLGAAVRFVVTPIGAIVTIVGAAIAVFLNWDSISRAVAGAAVATWRAVGDFFSRLIGNLAELFGGLGQIIAGAFTFDLAKIRAGFDQVVQGVAGLKTQFVEVGVAAVNAGKAALGFLDSLLTKTEDVLQKTIDGWVAYAEAVLAETEMTQRALVVLADKAQAESQALLDQGIAGWVAYADAVVAETEAAQLAAVEIAKQRATEEQAAAVAVTRGWVESAQAIIDATEEATRQEVTAADAVSQRLQAVPQQFRDISEAAGLSAADTQAAWSTYTTWFGTQMTTIQDISRQTWSTLSSGLGEAVAQSVIFGESLGKGLQNVMKGIGAAIIKMIVEMAAQWVISNAIMVASSIAKATVDVTAAAVVGGAWAWAAAVKKFGLVGVIVGAAIAAAVIAGIVALLSQIGSAQGGLENVPETGTFRLHRGERVLSRRQNLMLDDFLAGAGAGGGTVVINLNMSNVVADEIGFERFTRQLTRRVRRELA